MIDQDQAEEEKLIGKGIIVLLVVQEDVLTALTAIGTADLKDVEEMIVMIGLMQGNAEDLVLIIEGVEIEDLLVVTVDHQAGVEGPLAEVEDQLAGVDDL